MAIDVLALIAPDEHAVLVFLCQILVLLAVARALGWALAKVGQPAVVGELLSGIVVGPSILGRLSPDISDWLLPDTEVQGAMLFGVAWIGLLLLLAATGFESDLGVLRRLGRPALYVTAGSLMIPLVGGLLTGLIVPKALLGPEATTVVFAAFLAVALSISSLPVVARVLGELDLIRRNVGQLILAAAMANDVVGWILLGLVAGLAEAGGVDAVDLLARVLGVTAFLGFALTIGQRLVDAALRSVASSSPSTSAPTTLVLGIIVAAGALTHWMGVEAVLGAFVAGLVIGRSRWHDERVLRLIETIAHAFLAPLFFATAGLRVDLAVFADRTVAIWSVVIVFVATITKLFGSMIGARAGGLPSREGLALGIGLNARGALEIVIAAVGLSIGVLNDASYGAIVVMAIVTSLAAPPLLRIVLADWTGTEEEQARLEVERTQRSRIVVGRRPPLLLCDGEPPSIVAAQFLDLCWARDLPATVVYVGEDTPVRGAVENVLYERDRRSVKAGRDDSHTVLAEIHRGHGAVLVGLTDQPGGSLLSGQIQVLLAEARVPIVIVRSERMSGRAIPGVFARALVPVTGSINSRAAQELAAGLSSSIGTELVFTHLETAPTLPYENLGERGGSGRDDLSDTLLRTAAEVAGLSGAGRVTSLARSAASVPAELVRISLEESVDLVVVGATARRTSHGAHLGPIVSHLLEVCPATVVVVVTPPGWAGSQTSL